VKELDFLYSLARILKDPGQQLVDILEQLTQLIQMYWGNPEITSVSIINGEIKCQTKRFAETQWRQSDIIRVQSKEVGNIDIFYSENKLFPPRSHQLLRTIVDELAEFIERQNNRESLNKTAREIICLRSVSQILSNTLIGLETVFETFVHLITEAWQYPSICRASITYEGLIISVQDFEKTDWVQSADIIVDDKKVGELNVCYLEEKPEVDEGPFYIGERYLIDTLARELSGYIRRIRMEELKEQQHRELELYSSLIRHDLINDVQVIAGYVDISNEMFGMNNADLKSMLDSATSICRRMTGVLEAFKELPAEIERNPVRFIEKISRGAEESYANLQVTISSDSEVEQIRIPSSRLLSLVFDNLFRNAVQFAGNNAEISVVITAVNETVNVIFSDNGPGVVDEVRGKLFRKGVSTGGGGMGLYLTKQVLQTMGGSIELLESAPNEGARFLIILPSSS